MTTPSKDKNGKDKPLPKDYIGKSSDQILALEKAKWRTWVHNPTHGASELQKQQFDELLSTMVPSPDALPDHVPIHHFQLPLPYDMRGAVPASFEAPANQINMPAPAKPPPRLGYGALGRKAGEANREHSRKVKARKEAMKDIGSFPAIERGTYLLVQVTHAGTKHQLEWYVGKALCDYEEVKSPSGDEEVEVQWMYPEDPQTKQRASLNDLNARFTAWNVKGTTKSGTKNTETVDRCAIQLIEVEFYNNKSMKVQTKRAIADLLPAHFSYSTTTRSLTFKNPNVRV